MSSFVRQGSGAAQPHRLWSCARIPRTFCQRLYGNGRRLCRPEPAGRNRHKLAIRSDLPTQSNATRSNGLRQACLLDHRLSHRQGDRVHAERARRKRLCRRHAVCSGPPAFRRVRPVQLWTHGPDTKSTRIGPRHDPRAIDTTTPGRLFSSSPPLWSVPGLHPSPCDGTVPSIVLRSVPAEQGPRRGFLQRRRGSGTGASRGIDTVRRTSVFLF